MGPTWAHTGPHEAIYGIILGPWRERERERSRERERESKRERERERARGRERERARDRERERENVNCPCSGLSSESQDTRSSQRSSDQAKSRN